jgi:hypothetical protein
MTRIPLPPSREQPDFARKSSDMQLPARWFAAEALSLPQASLAGTSIIVPSLQASIMEPHPNALSKSMAIYLA